MAPVTAPRPAIPASRASRAPMRLVSAFPIPHSGAKPVAAMARFARPTAPANETPPVAPTPLLSVSLAPARSAIRQRSARTPTSASCAAVVPASAASAASMTLAQARKRRIVSITSAFAPETTPLPATEARSAAMMAAPTWIPIMITAAVAPTPVVPTSFAWTEVASLATSPVPAATVTALTC